ncbi:MAG: HU family DNA-binding protein, partial [Erysipelotrichaceae bacterium]|nr:HU family DNA-binding protein [Erysipelotrichaceae bacterium]
MTAINKKVLSEIVAEEHNLTKKEAAQIIDLVFDTISNTLKASGTEGDYVSRLEGSYAKSIRTEQSTGMIQEVLTAIPDGSKNLLSVLTLILGGIQVIRGN